MWSRALDWISMDTGPGSVTSDTCKNTIRHPGGGEEEDTEEEGSRQQKVTEEEDKSGSERQVSVCLPRYTTNKKAFPERPWIPDT